MFKFAKNRITVICVLVVALASITLIATASRVFARAETSANAAAGTPSYTVVMTEGHNLLVTDNAANKLYFYTIDKDKAIGSPLKLRASVDLTKVGGEEIRITTHNIESAK